MRISFGRIAKALLGLGLAGGLALASAACEPRGPYHTPERIQCLRYCAAQKDECIVNAHVATQLQQCDGQNLACVASCPI